MSVTRVEKNSNYTIVDNFYLRDKNISLKAKGLLSIILSLPDDWDYSVSGLAAVCGANEPTVKSVLNELKKYGYLIVTKKMPGETKSGRIEYDYNFCEQPQKTREQKQEVEKQGIEILPLEKQAVEIQAIENLPQLNTDIQNTEKQNISSEADDKRDGQLSLTEDMGNKSAEKDNRVITLSVKEVAERIYSQYPRQEGKAKGFERVGQLLKGKDFKVLGKVRYNHEQIYCAVQEYACECRETNREKQYTKMFDVFMSSAVVEYIEKSAAGYEKYMEREYGNEWRSIKFTYQ